MPKRIGVAGRLGRLGLWSTLGIPYMAMYGFDGGSEATIKNSGLRSPGGHCFSQRKSGFYVVRVEG